VKDSKNADLEKGQEPETVKDRKKTEEKKEQSTT